MEQRERVSTSHLPAGAHSSLENQVSLLNGRRLQATVRAVGSVRSLSLVPGDAAGSLYLSTFHNRPTGLLSVDTHCAGGEAVYGLQHPQSDRKNNPQGMWVIICFVENPAYYS